MLSVSRIPLQDTLYVITVAAASAAVNNNNNFEVFFHAKHSSVDYLI